MKQTLNCQNCFAVSQFNVFTCFYYSNTKRKRFACEQKLISKTGRRILLRLAHCPFSLSEEKGLKVKEVKEVKTHQSKRGFCPRKRDIMTRRDIDIQKRHLCLQRRSKIIVNFLFMNGAALSSWCMATPDDRQASQQASIFHPILLRLHVHGSLITKNLVA